MTSAAAAISTSAPAPAPAAAAPPFGLRIGTGLLGVLVAAIVAGLSNRVPGLALADVQGALGLARDDASWLTTAYAAGELAAMPFATWFAITFSMRRFHLVMLATALVLAAAMPFVRDLHLLLALRALQGVAAGALIPVLMMAALLFLPPPIRLHGLALYALTATFSPNVAPWLAALCVDGLDDWRWVYWHVIPPGLLAMALVAWGIPASPAAPGRLRTADWPGLALGVPGLALLVVALDRVCAWTGCTRPPSPPRCWWAGCSPPCSWPASGATPRPSSACRCCGGATWVWASPCSWRCW